MTSIFLLDDRIEKKTLLGRRLCPYASIASTKPATHGIPNWLRTAGLLASIVNGQILGIMLLGSSRRSHGVALCGNDGKTLRLWTSNLPGFRRIFRSLQEHGVPLDAQFDRFVAADNAGAGQAASDVPSASPSRAGSVAGAVLLCLAFAGALALQYWPAKAVTVAPHLEYSTADLAHRMELTDRMQKLADDMQQSLQQSQSGTPAEQKAAMETYETTMKKLGELRREYDAIRPTEE
jgi:hypothetical protein